MFIDRKRIILIGICFALSLFAAQVSLAATIVVDGSTCTLAQAITAANQPTSCGTSTYAGSTGADTITFNASYTSTITPGAQLTVTSDITIVGGGRVIDVNDNNRVFHVTSGHLRLDRLTVSNGSISSGQGAGILVNSGAALTVTNSNFNGHEGLGTGGAIASFGSLTVSNTSFTNNGIAGNSGGGAIAITGGSATITHVTMYSNTAGGANPTGGELLITSSAARVSLRNSILGDENTSSNDCGLTNSATLAQNIGNVIENGDTGCTTASNRRTIGISGTRGSPEAPTIDANSHANGAGDNAICKAYPTDQTGIRRPATACDAGAAERDGFNDIYVDSTCTIRQAIITAGDQSTQQECELGVDDDTAMDVIWLTQDATVTQSQQINVATEMRLEGQGYSISRTAGSDRIFLVNNNADFRLRNVSISGGNPGGDGGAFNVQGGAGIHLEDCVIKDNTSTSQTGGAIYFHSNHGTSTIDRCAFSNNRASASSGGAIRALGGTVTITNSTFTNNHSAADGGAIYIDGGTATLSHVTLWDNTSGTGYITGIRGRGTTNVNNSIIGRSATAGGALCGGSFNNSSSERGIIMWNGPIQNNPCGTVTVADPKLGAQTGSVPHFPLQVGSAAIGVGVDAQCALYPIDQAGNARPSSNCDAGAVQYIPPPSPKKAEAEAEAETRRGPRGATATPICSGDWLNWNAGIRVWATYGLCSGVQFKRLEAGWLTGNQRVIDAGFLDAVDVWGYAEQGVEVCFPAYGVVVLLDAATSPRTLEPLDAYLDGHVTCARFAKAGTAVLIAANSGLAAAPVAGGPSAGLANCMVTTTYVLNLRAEPNGNVIGMVAHNATLTALSRTADWFKVDANGVTGWISADYVTTNGSCG